MAKENVSLDSRKKIDETENYLLEEIKHYDLMSEKHEKVCRSLNYFENFLVFVPDVSGCVSISTFVSLVGAPAGIASSSVGLKICKIAAGIKAYKPFIKKKRKKHDNIMLLSKN